MMMTMFQMIWGKLMSFSGWNRSNQIPNMRTVHLISIMTTEDQIMIGQIEAMIILKNHLSFIEDIHAKYEESSHVLDIPNIDVESLNQEQLMAYNIAFKTLHLFISNNEDFEPLRMVTTGTAGSGKFPDE